MGARVNKFPGSRFEALCAIDDFDDQVEGHRGDEGAVRNLGSVVQVGDLLGSVNLDDTSVEGEALGRKRLCDGFPNSSSPVSGRESESSVGSPVDTGLRSATTSIFNMTEDPLYVPVTRCLLVEDVADDQLETRCRHTFSEPLTLHLCHSN